MSKYSGAYRAENDAPIEEDAITPIETNDDIDEADPEESSFKKRYGDLRRHTQSIQSSKDDEIKKLRGQLDDATRKQIKFPKTEDEINDWVARYPDVAAIVDTIAQKRAMEALELGEKKMANLQDLERKINRDRAEQELLKQHPDFLELRADKTFHEWVQIQPKWIQDALYENETDSLAASRAIDLFKSDTKRKPGRPAKDAAQAVSRSGGSAAPAGTPKGRFSESAVSKMTAQEYEKNEDGIMESMRNGTFSYDVSGGAR